MSLDEFVLWLIHCRCLTLVARFLTGFFLGAIPWYIGALILLFARVDYREKPGLVACMIAVSVHNPQS